MTVPLLASSVLFGSILVGFIGVKWNAIMKSSIKSTLAILVLIGILTSLLNHGTDHAVAMWIDRAFMVVTGLAFLAALAETTRRLYLFALMATAILFYAAAKLIRTEWISDAAHVACHGAATVFIMATLTDQQ